MTDCSLRRNRRVFVDLYFYLGIAFAMFMTGFGIPPAPEEAVIVGSGILAASGKVTGVVAWLACVTGIMAADAMLYIIGRFGGRPLLDHRWVKRILPPERRDHVIEGFHRHGVKILLTGRMLPGVRSGILITAGAIHYNPIKFMVADLIYALPVTGLIFIGSFYFADTFNAVIDNIHQWQNWLLLLLVIVAGSVGAVQYFRFLKARSANQSLEPPSMEELVDPEHAKHADAVPSVSNTPVATSPLPPPRESVAHRS